MQISKATDTVLNSLLRAGYRTDNDIFMRIQVLAYLNLTGYIKNDDRYYADSSEFNLRFITRKIQQLYFPKGIVMTDSKDVGEYIKKFTSKLPDYGHGNKNSPDMTINAARAMLYKYLYPKNKGTLVAPDYFKLNDKTDALFYDYIFNHKDDKISLDDMYADLESQIRVDTIDSKFSLMGYLSALSDRDKKIKTMRRWYVKKAGA